MAHALLMSLADAFLEVGVFVALLVAGFGWLRWRHGDRLLAVAERRRWAPLLGAVLGVSPGCAGAILVMPLYCRGSVSFGGVIAALVATMGDSSWVVMAADPRAAVTIHAVLFVSGLLSGYAVDLLGIRPALREDPAPRSTRDGAASAVRRGGVVPDLATPASAHQPVPGAGTVLVWARTAEPVVVAAFWLLAAGGALVAVPVAFQLVDPSVLRAGLSGPDLYLTTGVVGTAVAVVLTLHGRLGVADDSLETARATGAGEPFTAVLRHGARETSFVVTWVAAIYLAWTLVEQTTGFDGSELPLVGIAGVLVGALIGLVPGCAVQIVFTGLYLAGGMPFSTLIANALSQDGDALLPLLAEQSRSALLATCLTTVPGIVVGSLCLLLT